MAYQNKKITEQVILLLKQLTDVDGNMYPAANVLLQNPDTKQKVAKILKELHILTKPCQTKIHKPQRLIN